MHGRSDVRSSSNILCIHRSSCDTVVQSFLEEWCACRRNECMYATVLLHTMSCPLLYIHHGQFKFHTVAFYRFIPSTIMPLETDLWNIVPTKHIIPCPGRETNVRENKSKRAKCHILPSLRGLYQQTSCATNSRRQLAFQWSYVWFGSKNDQLPRQTLPSCHEEQYAERKTA